MRRDNYHIHVKNLRTNQEEGFMLAAGDSPFTVQGVDVLASRISEGEILYSDFTNSRVFAQSDWDWGVSKYWKPEIVYSMIKPTRQYWDQKNIEVNLAGGEFTLASGATPVYDFLTPVTQVSCLVNGFATGEVYAGLKGAPQIWKSIDFGSTWTLYKDYTTDPRFVGCDEISDIKCINTVGGYTAGSATGLGAGAQQIWFIAFDNTNNLGSVGKIYLNFASATPIECNFVEGRYSYHNTTTAANEFATNALTQNLNGNFSIKTQTYQQTYTVNITGWATKILTITGQMPGVMVGDSFSTAQGAIVVITGMINGVITGTSSSTTNTDGQYVLTISSTRKSVEITGGVPAVLLSAGTMSGGFLNSVIELGQDKYKVVGSVISQGNNFCSVASAGVLPIVLPSTAATIQFSVSGSYSPSTLNPVTLNFNVGGIVKASVKWTTEAFDMITLMLSNAVGVYLSQNGGGISQYLGTNVFKCTGSANIDNVANATITAVQGGNVINTISPTILTPFGGTLLQYQSLTNNIVLETITGALPASANATIPFSFAGVTYAGTYGNWIGKKLVETKTTKLNQLYTTSSTASVLFSIGQQSSVKNWENNIYSLISYGAAGGVGLNFSNSLEYNLALPTGYYCRSSATLPSGNIILGTQNGQTLNGTSSKVLAVKYALGSGEVPSVLMKPVVNDIYTIGEQAISAMTYLSGDVWIGTDPAGYIYLLKNVDTNGENLLSRIVTMPTIGLTTKNYIDSATDYGGNIVFSYQNGPGVFYINPVAGSSASGAAVWQSGTLVTIPQGQAETKRIMSILNTGEKLLIGTNFPNELYGYIKGQLAAEGYMQSSIYGGYISMVEKVWLYSYVRTAPWLADTGQRIRFEVSFDDGQTWAFCPKKKMLPLSTVITPDYEISFADNINGQCTFFFPPGTSQNTICHRTYIIKGTGVAPIVTAVTAHFNINYKQELLFNYNISLGKSQELLDGRTISVNEQQRKLAFLKDAWMNNDICTVEHVDGKTYTCISYSDDRTPGQGLVVQTSNSNAKKFDIDNLEYTIMFSLKTIANYELVI